MKYISPTVTVILVRLIQKRETDMYKQGLVLKIVTNLSFAVLRSLTIAKHVTSTGI